MAIKKDVVVKLVLFRGYINLYVYDPVQKDKRYGLGINSTEKTFDKDCRITSVVDSLRKAQGICEGMKYRGETFSYKRFDKEFLGKTISTSIYSFGEEHMKTVIEESTKQTFVDAFSSFKKYDGNHNLIFADITPKWIKGYQSFCAEKENKKNTYNLHLRTLRSLYNVAKKEGLAPTANPFEGIDLSSEPANLKYLTEKELKVFMNHKYKDPTGKAKWEEARDLFMFSYYAFGLNLMDMFLLKHSMIVEGGKKTIDGKTVMVPDRFVNAKGRRKTGSAPLQIRINESMQIIMDKYNDGDDLIFHKFMPVIKDKKERKKKHRDVLGWIVANLKRIAEQAKIPGHKEVVFYSARHTFAVHFINSGRTIFELMRCLGHESEQSTRVYLSRLMGTEAIDASKFDNILIDLK